MLAQHALLARAGDVNTPFALSPFYLSADQQSDRLLAPARCLICLTRRGRLSALTAAQTAVWLLTAGRVRREDLYDSSSGSEHSSEDDTALRVQLEAQVGCTLDLANEGKASSELSTKKKPSAEPDTGPTDRKQSSDVLQAKSDDEGGPKEYDFVLFGGSDAQQTKVVLENENEPLGAGGFVVPSRPLSYYMANEPSKEEREEYEFAAVTGDEVLSRSHWRQWSLEIPWKVTHISVVRKGGKVTNAATTDEELDAMKRKRPGKKRRIAMRLKQRASKSKAEAAAAQQAEKEEHIKDKKKRLNRLKKLRRRAKNRETKGTNGGDEDDDGGAGHSGSE